MLYGNYKDIIRQIKTAEEQTPDRKNLYLFKELEKPLKYNTRLLGHFVTRTTALSSFGWTISGIENFSDKDRLLERVGDQINYLINNHCYAPLFGKSCFKLMLVNNEYGSNLKIEKRLSNTEFTSDINYIYLYENNTFKHKVETDDIYYLLDDVQYLPFAGIMRAVTMLEIIRFDMILENANFLRKIKGILQIIDKGADSESHAAASTAAQTAIQNNYVITDDYIEFRLNQIASGQGTSFIDFIEMLNNDISIAVLGQANTTQLPSYGGSRAALQVLQLISKDIFYSDMIRVETLVNKYLMRDYKLNYEGLMPYKFKLNIYEEKDPEKNAATLETVSRIMPIKEDEAYEFVGFTPPKEGDKLLKIISNDL